MSKPKIVVLDSYTTTMNDLSWNELSSIGDVISYPRTSRSQIKERADGAEILLVNKVPLFEPEFEILHSLKYIGILATGYNNVDLDCARKRGVTVCNVPSYGTDSVAQNVFAHILGFANELGVHAAAVKRGEWCSSPDVNLCVAATRELAGLVIGIVGYGAIGSKVAEIAKAFGMQVIAYGPHRLPHTSENGTSFVPLDEIWEKSDIVSLNCPLNPDTHEIVNAKSISMMKRGVWIINTGRGGLVNERDLAEALESGRVGAAGLDVLSIEPPTQDNPLLAAKNCRISPHIAWTTQSARRRLIDIATQNVSAFLAGNPINVVS